LAKKAKALKAGRCDFSVQGAFLADESKSGALKISSRQELQNWLESLPPEQGRWVAVTIAARAALRVVPLVATDAKRKRDFENLTFAVFLATALARVAGKYPTCANELRGTPNYASTTNAAVGSTAFGAAANAALFAARASVNAAAAANAGHLDNAAAAAAANAAHFASHTACFRVNANDDNYADELWSAVSRDADFIAAGGTAQALASMPLRADSEPERIGNYWKLLQDALPRKDDWQVWIDWYNRRLEGVSDPEDIELIFATVPDKEREAGPAAANKWIKERLEELRKKESPPEIPRQGPGPHVEIDAETGAIVPAKPESLDAEGNNLARLNAHHPRIVRLAGELLANLGQNEHPELFAAAKSYFDNVNRDLNQIDFERLWGEGVYLVEAEAAAARRIKDAMREPLNDAALAALKALLQIHGPFILATKAGLENLAFANAYEMRPDEAKEQRAAAIELAQEFKDNPDVVAPETAANFAHFAEQSDSTKHPERSGAFRMGMALNIAIVIAAGATIGVIIVEIGLATGNPIAGLAALPLVEGLKKSKSFLEVSVASEAKQSSRRARPLDCHVASLLAMSGARAASKLKTLADGARPNPRLRALHRRDELRGVGR
jgi:hypothetical protein